MKVTAYTMSKQFIENNDFCQLSNVPMSLLFCLPKITENKFISEIILSLTLLPSD